MSMDFESADAARNWADVWTQDHARQAIPAAERLREYEQQSCRRIVHDFGRWVDCFGIQYGLVAQLVDEINYVNRSLWPGHREIQFALIAQNLSSLHSAYALLLRGHPEDALTLARKVYETFVAAIFVSCHPADLAAVLSGVGQPPNGHKAFKVTNFVRDELKFDWSSYQIMSVFAHRSQLALAESWVAAEDRQGSPEAFGLWGLEYDQRITQLAISQVRFALVGLLRFVTELFAQGIQLDDDRLALADESASFLMYQLRIEPANGEWPKVAADLDFLFAQVLPVAEREEDWKAVIKRRSA